MSLIDTCDTHVRHTRSNPDYSTHWMRLICQRQLLNDVNQLSIIRLWNRGGGGVLYAMLCMLEKKIDCDIIMCGVTAVRTHILFGSL